MITPFSKRNLVRDIRDPLREGAPQSNVSTPRPNMMINWAAADGKWATRLHASQQLCFIVKIQGMGQASQRVMTKWMTRDKHQPQIVSTHASMLTHLSTDALGNAKWKE
jgi:hypothetical protein